MQNVYHEIPGVGLVSSRSLEKDLCTSSLKYFISRAWQYVEPSTPLKWNWHLDVVCSKLESLKPGDKIIFNLPPGTMKSMIISVALSAWVWARDASQKFLLASYTDTNPIRDNRRCRDIVISDWYKKLFSVELSKMGEERFDTAAKGWRIATSVGGVGTGEHPDYIIIDDPLKAQDANSEVKLAVARNWISGTMSTRVARNPIMILVMQRLNMKDPTEFLLSKGWQHVCFPMRYEPSRSKSESDPRGYTADLLDTRTEKGELLWPEVFTEERVDDMELLLGPYGTASQLQQQPVPIGGGLFKREYFDYVDDYPRDCVCARGWDTADTELIITQPKRGNWTVGVKIGYHVKSKLFYVIHVIRTKSISSKVHNLIIDTAATDGELCKIREGSGSGKATIESRTAALAGYDYEASPENSASGNKIQRSDPFRVQCQARNVKIVRGSWNEAFLDVLCGFPTGEYDDDVDGASNAFNALVGSGIVVRRVYR